jgi:hypothetical protein
VAITITIEAADTMSEEDLIDVLLKRMEVYGYIDLVNRRARVTQIISPESLLTRDELIRQYREKKYTA